MNRSDATLSLWVRRGLSGFAAVSAVGSFVVTGLAWVIPAEVFQGWAVSRVDPADYFAKIEAYGTATAAAATIQWCGPVLTAILIGLWWRRRRVAPWIEGALWGFWHVTDTNCQKPKGDRETLKGADRLGQFVTATKRLAIISALVLSLGHWAAAVQQRLKDWSYYRWRDGNESLPNISDSNIAVIRYLRSATPENCRILVVSDQKLFFLSYYLRPRQLYHRIHPSAEHLIPRANQARQLAAYRLDELPPDVWNCHPHYVLEYFEGAEYIDPARVSEDAAWLHVFQSDPQNTGQIPGYVVRLRQWPPTEGQP